MTALQLLEESLLDAFEHWTAFTDSRSEENWRAYCASVRRAHMINLNCGINFTIGRPVIRVPVRT
jgi:hypothetical protein